MIGTIKWYNAAKGYGFIAPDDGGKDIFIHISQLEKIGIHQIIEGMRVEYSPYNDFGRIAAGNIKLISTPDSV